MTKERKLAIEMWWDIRDMISASDRLPREVIKKYKSEFCEQHELDWHNDCWFCQYRPSCFKCPLKECLKTSASSNPLYVRVLNPCENKDARIEACNNIIKALGGEV